MNARNHQSRWNKANSGPVMLRPEFNLIPKHARQRGKVEHWYRDGRRIDIRWPDGAVSTGISISYVTFSKLTPAER
jgi:hypothetical protein